MEGDLERGVGERDTHPESLQPPLNNEKPKNALEKVKDAKKESSGAGDFFKKLCGLFVRTIGCTISLGITLIIPIIAIAIGAKYLKGCPKERFVPIFLIVWGVFMAISLILNMIQNMRQRHQDEEKDLKPNPLSGIVSTFLFAWFIAGNVWVFRIYKKFSTEDPTADDFCHPTVYYTAFSFIIIAYILILLTLCCMICGCLCIGLAVTGSGSETEKGTDDDDDDKSKDHQRNDEKGGDDKSVPLGSTVQSYGTTP